MNIHFPAPNHPHRPFVYQIKNPRAEKPLRCSMYYFPASISTCLLMETGTENHNGIKQVGMSTSIICKHYGKTTTTTIIIIIQQIAENDISFINICMNIYI